MFKDYLQNIDLDKFKIPEKKEDGIDKNVIRRLFDKNSPYRNMTGNIYSGLYRKKPSGEDTIKVKQMLTPGDDALRGIGGAISGGAGGGSAGILPALGAAAATTGVLNSNIGKDTKGFVTPDMPSGYKEGELNKLFPEITDKRPTRETIPGSAPLEQETTKKFNVDPKDLEKENKKKEEGTQPESDPDEKLESKLEWEEVPGLSEAELEALIYGSFLSKYLNDEERELYVGLGFDKLLTGKDVATDPLSDAAFWDFVRNSPKLKGAGLPPNWDPDPNNDDDPLVQKLKKLLEKFKKYREKAREFAKEKSDHKMLQNEPGTKTRIPETREDIIKSRNFYRNKAGHIEHPKKTDFM